MSLIEKQRQQVRLYVAGMTGIGLSIATMAVLSWSLMRLVWNAGVLKGVW